MAFGNVKYQGDGNTTTFGITFPYIDRTHIKVYVDGVLTTNYTWPTPSTIQLPTAPAAGILVSIMRETPIDAKLVDFQNASMLKEADLDKNSDQLLYAMQESVDDMDTALRVDADNKYDFQGRGMKNIAAPTKPDDVVTKGYADTVIGQAQSQATAAATSASQAAASASAAKTSETNAKASEINAAASATQAASTLSTTNSNITNLQNRTSSLEGRMETVEGTLSQPTNADTLDTYHAGNESGQIPVSNGTLNVGLNADKLDGNEASAFLKETDVITGTLTLSPGGTSSLVTHGRNTQYPLVGIYATSSVSLGQFVKVNFVNTTQCSFTLDSNVGSSITFRYIIR